MIEDGKLQAVLDERYAGWDGDLGRRIRDGGLSLADLSEEVLKGNIEPRPRSGRQEALENLANTYL